MFRTPDDERQARVEALQTVLERAMQTRMESASRRLGRLVLESKPDIFRRALTSEPAADVEPPHVVPKPDTARDRVKAKSRHLSP